MITCLSTVSDTHRIRQPRSLDYRWLRAVFLLSPVLSCPSYLWTHWSAIRELVPRSLSLPGRQWVLYAWRTRALENLWCRTFWQPHVRCWTQIGSRIDLHRRRSVLHETVVSVDAAYAWEKMPNIAHERGKKRQDRQDDDSDHKTRWGIAKKVTPLFPACLPFHPKSSAVSLKSSWLDIRLSSSHWFSMLFLLSPLTPFRTHLFKFL